MEGEWWASAVAPRAQSNNVRQVATRVLDMNLLHHDHPAGHHHRTKNLEIQGTEIRGADDYRQSSPRLRHQRHTLLPEAEAVEVVVAAALAAGVEVAAVRQEIETLRRAIPEAATGLRIDHPLHHRDGTVAVVAAGAAAADLLPVIRHLLIVRRRHPPLDRIDLMMTGVAVAVVAADTTRLPPLLIATIERDD